MTAVLQSKSGSSAGSPSGKGNAGGLASCRHGSQEYAVSNSRSDYDRRSVNHRDTALARPSLKAFINGQEDKQEMKSTFIDAEAMKEKVRQNLLRPQHHATDAYKTTGVAQAIARSRFFEYITLAVVALNALWIAIDTDHNTADLLLNAHPMFIFAENAFCLAFFLEWVVKYTSYEHKLDGLKDSWFVFDSLLVFMMVMETWVMTLLILAMGGAGGIGGNASILRIARLLRLSRMARMARLLRALPELMIMIRGMVAAARSVFFTLCLLIIVLYVFAIAFTQLCVDTTIGVNYFDSVPNSMFSLLIYGTLLDNIGIFANELGAEAMHIAVLFFFFVLIAALTIMNMLIGVLCEVVNAVAATEREEMLVTYVNQKLQRVVSLLDTDGGGTISKNEFLQILDNVDAVRCLNDVGVDVIGLVDFVDFIFESDESNEAEDDIELDFGKFMDVVLQLRGCNNATVKDVVDLRKLVKKSATDMKAQMSQLLHQLETTKISGTFGDCHKNMHPVNGTSSNVAAVSQQNIAAEKERLILDKIKQLPEPIKERPFSSPSMSTLNSDVLTSPTDISKVLDAFDQVENESPPAVFQASVQTFLLRPDASDETNEPTSMKEDFYSPSRKSNDGISSRGTAHDESAFAAPDEQLGNGAREIYVASVR